MKLAAAEQMRMLDRQTIQKYGVPSLDLMERAAEGIRDAVLKLLPDRPGKCRVSILCGSGNNGGDGIAAARLLFLSGVKVRAFLVGNYEKLTQDALDMTGRLSECGVELEPFTPEKEEQKNWILCSDVLIDALFGTGLSRKIAPNSLYYAAVQLMNKAAGKVVAADIASGVDTDSGQVLCCGVKADVTVTFTLPKIGQFSGAGGVLSGRVDVHDIGIPKALVNSTVCTAQTVEPAFIRSFLPRRNPGGHKGTFGKMLIIGGCPGFTGAPYLAAGAAVRSGCGLVYLGVPESIWAVEAVKCSSAMPFSLPSGRKEGTLQYGALLQIQEKLHHCDVLALGPGLGRSKDVTRLVCDLLLRTEKPVVLDADGINALSEHMDILDARRGRTTILTPHDGEFARLGGNLSGGDRIGAAVEFAKAHGCVLVLKGHNTITAAPAGNALVNTTGNSGLAKGGSGDVLTGVIASLLCQGMAPVQAAACGVWLHGCAGNFAAGKFTEYGVTPSDVIAFLPQAFASVSDTK